MDRSDPDSDPISHAASERPLGVTVDADVDLPRVAPNQSSQAQTGTPPSTALAGAMEIAARPGRLESQYASRSLAWTRSSLARPSPSSRLPPRSPSVIGPSPPRSLRPQASLVSSIHASDVYRSLCACAMSGAPRPHVLELVPHWPGARATDWMPRSRPPTVYVVMLDDGNA
ncbi:hypothetical protein C8Q80DRAFT_1276481 [Daedaleopsis nitida]|nr:hypothetical protein C8Q80DRAFT_1276481 [Daedaleopsis nitida]